MTIAILTDKSAQNPKTWSGIAYQMSRAIERRFPVHYIGVEDPNYLNALKLGARLLRGVTGQRYLASHSPRLAKRYAQRFEALSRSRESNLIFAIASSTTLSRCRTDLPVVYTSDATVRLMLDYYPRFTRLARSARKSAEAIEQSAITRADLLLYPTWWAANSAIQDYGVAPEKVRVVPFGANLDEDPDQDAIRYTHEFGRRESRPLRLLLVGVDWEVKGCDRAVRAMQHLERQGIASTLTICGCTPPRPLNDPRVNVIPFLDKNVGQDRLRLIQLYRDADFLILPSRCECFGIVLCEAAAFGVPAIASRTGGIPEVIQEGKNGFTIDEGDEGEGYAERIRSIWENAEAYEQLRITSRQAFEERLNWNIWGDVVNQELVRLLQERGSMDVKQ